MVFHVFNGNIKEITNFIPDAKTRKGWSLTKLKNQRKDK